MTAFKRMKTVGLDMPMSNASNHQTEQTVNSPLWKGKIEESILISRCEQKYHHYDNLCSIQR